jgi:hypothetical protein
MPAMNDGGGGMRAQQCSKQDMQRSGNTITVDSACIIGGATTTSRAVVTGDFNAGYTVKVASKREGGPAVPGMYLIQGTELTEAEVKLGGWMPLRREPASVEVCDTMPLLRVSH